MLREKKIFLIYFNQTKTHNNKHTKKKKIGEVERKWKFQGGTSNPSACGGEHETVHEQEAATECWYTFSYQNMRGEQH